MKKIEIRDSIARPSVARPLKAGLLMAFFSTKPIGQETGLGLSLSYDIVKLHNGRIEVESREGAGTEFIIQLPIV